MGGIKGRGKEKEREGRRAIKAKGREKEERRASREDEPQFVAIHKVLF